MRALGLRQKHNRNYLFLLMFFSIDYCLTGANAR